MQDDSSAKRRRTKYAYPSDDELIAAMTELRSLTSVARKFAIPFEPLRGYLRRNPALFERLKAIRFDPDERLRRRKANGARWKRENRERARELERERYYRNVEDERSKNRRKRKRFRQSNPEKEHENAKRYRAANPDYRKHYYRRNRAKMQAQARLDYYKRKKGAPYTRDSLDYVQLIVNDPCVYCGADSGTIDHIVPVSSGGDSSPDNLAPACLSCNSSKHTKSLLEFLLQRR